MKSILLLLGLLSFTIAEESQLLKQFSEGYDNFTTHIYKELIRSTSKNFIVCPLSVDVLLALISSGAEGETSKQITNALNLPEKHEDVHKTFSDLSPYLQGNDKYDLTAANKIYIKEGFNISDKYLNISKDIFNAEIQSVNFTNNVETANEINKWVENKTHNKITNIVNPSIFDVNTINVLINAIYFHGKWVKEFDEMFSARSSFHVNRNSSVETDTMLLVNECEYYESIELEAKFLKLDYQGGDVSMHIVLPNDIEGLAALEEKMTDVLIPPPYEMYSVYATVPKFKIETEIKFIPILQSLGIKDLFEDTADLRGILAEQENLSVSEVIQKAFIEVDEKGTTAAATTFALIDIRSGNSNSAFFNADHPFLFYLRLNKVGINFFVGRYISP
ncbi:hypothetical protein ILUMI_11059 [Ignelater luminosus]|uniref:Serpin domain-containing protein n=1 Tax=Ignelater luminosus TaxID=2038154 RepID=A0A8K0CZ64_IGNLU|nr:hypothetical protein ILUMI_11059 [Ignelater luminosus]